MAFTRVGAGVGRGRSRRPQWGPRYGIIIIKNVGSGDRTFLFCVYAYSDACFLKGDARMVHLHSEQEVLDLVDNEHVSGSTEPLRDMFVGAFEESMLSGKEQVFIENDTPGYDAHATTGGTFVTPVDASESY